jgi:NAD(P)-dependent dehydrogenase (short-subunit alcohol dehydrogenase family)
MDVTDLESVARAAAECGDTTLLVNNAGIAAMLDSTLNPAILEMARDLFDTNYYGVIRVTQAFAPVLQANGGGAIVNVLSDAAWLARPFLSAYSASKAAAWSYTNALRVELRDKGIQVQGVHVGFLDTDMTHGFDMKKTSPRVVAQRSLDGIRDGLDEVIVDESTTALKASLSGSEAQYLNPPAIA